MLFCIICTDKPNAAPLRAETRPVHLQYLERFKDRIAIAGPLLTDDGTRPKASLMILDFASAEEAAEFAQNDPYAKAGLFDNVTITPFKKVLPAS
jgi:uncharacterized protein YciI